MRLTHSYFSEYRTQYHTQSYTFTLTHPGGKPTTENGYTTPAKPPTKYTTVTQGYSGTVQSTSTRYPNKPGSPGIVIIYSPTNVGYTKPIPTIYKTITGGWPGSTTQKITLPGHGKKTKTVTVIVQTPTSSAYSGKYTTITTSYGGSTTRKFPLQLSAAMRHISRSLISRCGLADDILEWRSLSIG